MLLLQLLMMTSALQSIPGADILRHILEKFVASPLFLRSHLVFVIFHEDNILCVL